MKVLLNGKEFKCQSFSDAKAGDVIVMNHGIFLKMDNGHVVNLCNGHAEVYNNFPVVVYPDAVMMLKDEKHC